MLCCIGEIVCFIFGIIALVKGQFNLTRNRIVQGASARVIGVLLLLPLAIGQGGGALYGAIWGMQQVAKGRQVDIATATRELETPALIINLVGGAVPLVAAFIVALATAKPRARKPSFYQEDEEDDYDDRGRPRRRSKEEPLD